ncbi:endolysin [Streptomyces phage Jaylociraptor]|uniref:Endolysin n=6 Tax=Rimavirus rima TaxID=2560784 RepID=A0A7T3KB43_9CAUD|nr:endolysin [Streptomyces phage Spectropatronm]QAY16217.1 endolysin [Streptomyces phage IceWarrior]QEQ93698.1 endolysin [Streptomyces phage Jaylociraptor]QEQ94222.1 endolysin [Streptomyces phage Hoshi]QGJ96704.1 endolysin [Streptomyces phage FidgetOrca]QPX62032.1 endolysin [Streptomyces phage Indigenous]
MTTYAHASAKLGPIKDATKSISREVFDAAQEAGHDVWYMWGYDNNASNTEHHSGRALDFMVRNKAAGDWVRNYIWKHRKRLRLQHVIWYQKITSTVTSPGVVRGMADRGNTTANHKDHVHALFFSGSYQSPSSPSTPSTPDKKSVTEIAKAVLRGEYGNNPQRERKLRAEGYNPTTVQLEVNRLMGGDPPVKKTVSQIANEIIEGRGGWGNGSDRVNRLKKAGYNPTQVQAEVNRLLTPKGETKPKLTISQVATQVIRGDWGNGAERKSRLTKAGYNYAAVQAEVNRRA